MIDNITTHDMNNIHAYCSRVSELSCRKESNDFEIDRCLEEMSELAKELLKDRRYGINGDLTRKERVLSELGDVILTLHHIQTVYEFLDSDIIKATRMSIDRLIEEQTDDNKD